MLLLSPDPDICTSCTWICICICICVRICFWNLLQLLVAGCLRVVAASGVDDLPAGCWRGKEVELERHPTKTQAKTTSTFYIYRVAIRSARVAQTAKEGGEGRFGNRLCFFFRTTPCHSVCPPSRHHSSHDIQESTNQKQQLLSISIRCFMWIRGCTITTWNIFVV